MTIMGDCRRSMVNGAQLPGFTGKNIVIFGLVSNASPGDTTFTLRSTDNITIPIILGKPLTTAINGYVEVRGVAQGKSVEAEAFYTFSNQNFDAKGYNMLCQFENSIPNLFYK